VRRKWKKILCLGAASSLSLLCANLRAKTCVEIIPEAFITLSLSRFNDVIRVYFITLKNGGAAAGGVESNSALPLSSYTIFPSARSVSGLMSCSDASLIFDLRKNLNRQQPPVFP
jgi:hypothetical protein